MIKDGWHEITEDIAVYTEGGMILLAINGNRPAAVYRFQKDGLNNMLPVRYDTFRKGWREDRYTVRGW